MNARLVGSALLISFPLGLPVAVSAAMPASHSTWSVPAALVDDEPIVLKVDEQTKMPLGDMVEPRGVIIDPRDIPQPVIPHVNVAQGLEGLEGSLTGLFARSIGFAVERKKLDKAYHPLSKSQRDDWNTEVRGLAGTLTSKDEGTVAYAAVYHDTGRRIFPEKWEMHVVGAPDIALLPMTVEEAEAFMRMEYLVNEFGEDMEPELAKELRAIVSEKMEGVEDPWFGHSLTQLMKLELGMWEAPTKSAEIFKITPAQFMERIQWALKEALVDPLKPEYPGNNENGVKYLFEGLAAVVVADARTPKEIKDNTRWTAPKALKEHNKRTRKPILLFKVPKLSKYTPKSKFKRAQISMLVGATEKTLYDGPLPLK